VLGSGFGVQESAPCCIPSRSPAAAAGAKAGRACLPALSLCPGRCPPGCGASMGPRRKCLHIQTSPYSWLPLFVARQPHTYASPPLLPLPTGMPIAGCGVGGTVWQEPHLGAMPAMSTCMAPGPWLAPAAPLHMPSRCRVRRSCTHSRSGSASGFASALCCCLKKKPCCLALCHGEPLGSQTMGRLICAGRALSALPAASGCSACACNCMTSCCAGASSACHAAWEELRAAAGLQKPCQQTSPQPQRAVHQNAIVKC